MTTKTKNLTAPLLVLFVALVASGYFYSQDDVNSNSRLALVKAIVEENRFAIDSYHDGVLKTEDESFYQGHYYSDKAIGSSLVGAEFYAPLYKLRGGPSGLLSIEVFKATITLLAISLLCAVLAPLLYSLVRQVSKSSRYALLISLGICMGTPFYVYSSAYYGHSLAALLLFAAFYLWYEMKATGAISGTPAFCSGCLLGFAVITEYPTAIIALAIGIYILHVMFQQQQLRSVGLYAAILAGIAIPAGAVLLYNYSVFHSVVAIGYDFESVGVFRAVESTGFMGLGKPEPSVMFYMTFHTTMGIFWQSPLLLLAVPGWIAMWRSRDYRAEAVLCAGVALGYVVLLSGYYAWWGGLSFTPRHLVPVLPFFGIPLAFLTGKMRKVALPLAIISVMQMLVVIAARYDGLGNITIGYSQGLVYRMFQNSTIYNVYLPNLLAGRLAPNLGEKLFGLTGLASLMPFLFAELSLVLLFLLVTRYPRTSRVG